MNTHAIYRWPLLGSTRASPPAEVTEANAVEERTHRWSAEASGLGLPPGIWPERLATTLGNGRDLIRADRPTSRGGDEYLGVESVTYRQELGCVEVEVLND